MGSDVRVDEMLRQIRHILGAERVDFSVMSQNFEFSKGYFEGTKQVHLPDIFPPFLSDEVPKHHGVVACEGSMFKSKFANALTTMMIGSLGIAAVENKLSVGYGAEAGHMDPLVAKMCGRYCKNSLVITRNEESRTVLRELGVPTELGTDTAWTFEPRSAEYGQSVLRQVGWDGQTPVLVVCPDQSVRVAGESLGCQVRSAHSRLGPTKTVITAPSIFTTQARPPIAPTSTIWTSIANAVDAFRKRRNVFVILAATERSGCPSRQPHLRETRRRAGSDLRPVQHV